MKKLLYKLHLLSLDVVLGAIIMAVVFWKLPFGTNEVNWPSVASIGITIFIIYIADRLLDIRHYSAGFSARHNFHYKNKQNLLVLVTFLVAAQFLLLFFLPVQVIWFGITVGSILLTYFLILNFLLKNTKVQWVKEPVTSIFYTICVALPPVLISQSITASMYILYFLLFLVVSQNLLVFSYFESLSKPNIKNTVSAFGNKLSIKIAKAISFLVIVLSLVFFFREFNYVSAVALVLLLMSVFLLFVMLNKDTFIKNDNYRWLADSIFVFPVFLFLFF